MQHQQEESVMQFGFTASALSIPRRKGVFPVLAASILALAAGDAIAQTPLFKAVNRLVDLQADSTGDNARNGTPDIDPDDGGWDFDITLATTEHSMNPSPDNTYGVTALGFIRAWKGVGRSPRVVIAISDTAEGMLANPNVETGLDFALLNLTGGFLGDPSYKPEARARWDAKIASVGGPQALAQSIMNGRAAQGLDGLFPWDINQWVMSAFFMEKSYPGVGYRQQGQIMAQVIFNDLFSVSPVFDKNDPTEPFYNLGLMGAHLAFRLTRQFETESDVLRFNLVSRQNVAGWWAADDQFPGAHVQTTAWVVTSLFLFKNDPLYFAAGQNGSNYLASSQDAGGGWNLGGGDENTEVNGECVLALALYPPSSFTGGSFAPPPSKMLTRPPASPFDVR
jgi:hypothetical protein